MKIKQFSGFLTLPRPPRRASQFVIGYRVYDKWTDRILTVYRRVSKRKQEQINRTNIRSNRCECKGNPETSSQRKSKLLFYAAGAVVIKGV